MRSTSLALILLCAAPFGYAQKEKPSESLMITAPNAAETAVLVHNAPGPNLEIITVDGKGKATNLIRITSEYGKVLLTVHLDGSVEPGEGYKPDEAAKEFWKALAAFYPKVCNVAQGKEIIDAK